MFFQAVTPAHRLNSMTLPTVPEISVENSSSPRNEVTRITVQENRQVEEPPSSALVDPREVGVFA